MKKRIVSLFLALVTLSLLIVIPANAATIVTTDSGYNRKDRTDDLGNGYSATEFDCTMTRSGTLWNFNLTWEGTSRTRWMGTNPYNATNVFHWDYLTFNGSDTPTLGGNCIYRLFHSSDTLPSYTATSYLINNNDTAVHAYGCSNFYHISPQYTYLVSGKDFVTQQGMYSIGQTVVNGYTYTMDTRQ